MGDLALLIAVFCLILNLYNFGFIRRARKKPYYSDPLFWDTALKTEDPIE